MTSRMEALPAPSRTRNVRTTNAPGLPAPAGELAFLLDIDGTLLDIAPTPRAVLVPATLRQTLARIGKLSDGALALISGRSLQDIDRIFAPIQLPAIGGHGAEFRPVKGKASLRGRATPLSSALRQRLAGIAALGPGIIVEDKGYSLALHYRQAPKLKRAIERAVDAVRAETPGLEALPGKAVIEIKHKGLDKRKAVRRLMEFAPFAGRRPVFIGDDYTDESVFAVLPEFNGIGFSVGRKMPGAAGSFETPRDVRQWLDRISKPEAAAAP